MKRRVLFFIITLMACFWASPFHAASSRAQTDHQNLTSSACLACHNNADLAKEVDGKIVSLHVSEKGMRDSVHRGLECASCHTDVKSAPHTATPAKVICGQCHIEAQQAYNTGLHAKAIQNGNRKAASCLDCHGNAHTTRRSTDPKSKTNHANIAATCGACHGEQFVMEGTGISARPFLSYKESVHGRAVANGNAKAAVCTECHGSHDIRPPNDAQSPIFKFNVPQTCGQCHANINNEFMQSTHGQAIARGNTQAPVCTDCHGIHMIKPHVDPASSVAAQALAKTTCAQCHESVKLAQEFGVADKRASSYLDSYHGLASKLGSQVIANCASCHGIHNILPSSDPKSMINRDHLVQTCGKCHPGASDNFVLGRVHLDVPNSRDISSTATRWVRWIYLSLIGVIIGGMVLHNALVWRKKAAARRRAANRTIIRMTVRQRVQHWLLLTSFFALVLTGFALKYPDSWLADLLFSSEAVRRLGHRFAAVVMIIVGLYHIGYLLLSKEGRDSLQAIWPRRKDITDALENVLYYLNLTERPPKFAKFNYAEKAEYWAVIWGTFVMGATGLMVWFKVELFGFLPRWVIDVALAIHFYEAILATAAIIVWHLYNVIFDPDVYPINWALVDGRVTEAYYQHEHALDYEEIMAARQTEAQTASDSAAQAKDQAGEPGLPTLPSQGD